MAPKTSYRYCFVPGCSSTTISTPEKIFFHVRKGIDNRKKWCEILGGTELSSSHPRYCCEDHFNLEEDVEDWVRYKILMSEGLPLYTLRLKKGVLPYRFDDQPKLKVAHPKPPRSAVLELNAKDAVRAASLHSDSSSKSTEEIPLKTRMVDNTILESNLSSLETSHGRTVVRSEPLSALLKEENEFKAEDHLFIGHSTSIEISQSSQATDFVIAGTSLQDVGCKLGVDFQPCGTQECIPNFEKDEEIVNNKIVTYKLVGNDTERSECATTPFENAIDYDEVDLMNLFEDVGCKNNDASKENEQLSLVVSESGELIGVEADGILHHSDDTSNAVMLSNRPNHRKIVTGTSFSRPYSCKHCSRRFRFSSELKEHSKDHVTKIFYSCDHCLASFKSKTKLCSHLKEQSCNGKKFACDKCPQKFSHANSLKRHLCLHSPKHVFSCDECSAKYSQKRSLEVHLKTHFSSKQCSCPHCPQKFRLKSSLGRHLKKHDNKSAYVCDFCCAKFYQIMHLKNHLMMHKGERPFTCAHCPAKFSRKGNLNRHIKDVHFASQQYPCSQCSRSFSHSSSLKRHLEKHNKENPFNCTYCSMKFKEKRRLKSHLALHLRKVSFSCEHCPAQFSLKKELRRHMSIHFKDLFIELPKPAVQFHCSDEFKRHVHSQQGKQKRRKRFFCTLCPASFTQNKVLRSHLAKHSE